MEESVQRRSTPRAHFVAMSTMQIKRSPQSYKFLTLLFISQLLITVCIVQYRLHVNVPRYALVILQGRQCLGIIVS